MSYRLAIFAVLFGVGFLLPAYAQDATPPAQSQPAPVEPAKSPKPAKPKTEKKAEEPIKTTNYGDWSLRCREGEVHACEISQTIQAPDQSGPIAKISIGRPDPGGDLHIVIILPNNVSFPSSVHLRTNSNDKWGFELAWLRCIPGGCFADAALNDATLAHWHSLNDIGGIVFRDAAGDEVSLPMTFRGFGDALDALKKS
jgi:invasion protein IalB